MAHNYCLLDYPNAGKIYGNFKGKYPSQAAKKIVSFLSKEYNFSNSKSKKLMVFNIRNKNTKKEYKYVGTRIKLHSPHIIYKDNKKIEFKYKNIATRYKDYYENNTNMKGGNTEHVLGQDSSSTNYNGTTNEHSSHETLKLLHQNIKGAAINDNNVKQFPVIVKSTYKNSVVLPHKND